MVKELLLTLTFPYIQFANALGPYLSGAQPHWRVSNTSHRTKTMSQIDIVLATNSLTVKLSMSPGLPASDVTQ
jgi:hypothetical protein